MDYIQVSNRHQISFGCLDEQIHADNPVRFIEAFVEQLDLDQLQYQNKTLINFLNMKRVNTRGIEQANKHVLMAALTYNLKKYLKFISKKVNTKVMAMQVNPENFLPGYLKSLFASFLPHPGYRFSE